MNTLSQRNALDIETGPQAFESILHLRPQFNAPSNYKDPDKIAANIVMQEAKWLADAALSPITGEILLLGVKPFGKDHIIFDGAEHHILLGFWELFERDRNVEMWCGHNIQAFDFPFIIKRSWVHGIKVPMDILFPGAGRYLNDRRVFDTMVAFQCGNRNEFVSLDTVSKFFGFPGKDEDISANFAEVYAQDPERGINHLKGDLDRVEEIVNRMYPEVQVA